MDEGLRIFLLESRENLQRFEEEIVVLAAEPSNGEVLRSIFRTLHTLKGMCGFLQLERLGRIAHLAEEILMRMREGELPVSRVAIDAILAAVDVIRIILDGLERDGTEPEGDDRSLLLQLERAMEAMEAKEAAGGHASTGPGQEALADAAEPAFMSQPREVTAAQTLRVDVAVLDRLMNRIEELVLARNRLSQLVQRDEDSLYRSPIQELDRVTTELQDVVMQARMQDIAQAWRRLPRILRDLCQTTGKMVDLKMVGGETQIDRQVLDAIEEPFIHLVRNSVDHGIELAGERERSGKRPAGTVELRARQDGGHIVVEILDDGRGIDLESVRRKLRERPEFNSGRVENMTDSQLLECLFLPGFTTAPIVTEVSGRGVGMDVVRSKVESVAGTVTLRSTPGKGTCVQIKIPLTLAISSALIVEAAGETFAIPQLNIQELVRIQEEDDRLIENVPGSTVLRLREKLLTLVSLSTLLDLPQRQDRPPEGVVVLSTQDTTFGLMVDRVVDTVEIVVKPLGRLVSDLVVYAGTTVLGDGKVIMILDPVGLSRRGRLDGPLAPGSAVAPGETVGAAQDRMSLLVFEDGTEGRKAVPLPLVTRLEEFSPREIELTSDRRLVQYRGGLLPLVSIDRGDEGDPDRPRPVIVFSDGARSMGLMVRRIIDIVDQVIQLDARACLPGIAGVAVVDGHATEIIDMHHFLQLADPEWFTSQTRTAEGELDILLVDDSGFFRQMLAPLLSALGHRVHQASHGEEALGLLESGLPCDLLLSDLVMPRMDGYELISRVRADPRLAGTPAIALTVRSTSRDRERAVQVGFDDFLVKLDRDAVTAAIRHAASRVERCVS